MTTLDDRYRAIQKTVASLSDFSDQTLAPSRQLFEFAASNGDKPNRPIPKRFEVWTNLVGLPLPPTLTTAFNDVWQRIISGLSLTQRYYSVQPNTYHWELFIIKRPDETVTETELHQSAATLRQIISQHSPLTLTYRGFVITPDGTVLVKGYGDIDPLRAQLRNAIPWASAKQSQLGHVSLGRLLDPVGPTYFAELNQYVQDTWDTLYGTLTVDTIKWVHESQWYMEDHDIIDTIMFKR